MFTLPSQIPFERAVKTDKRDHVSEQDKEGLDQAGGTHLGSEFMSAGTENSKGKKQKLRSLVTKSEEWLRFVPSNPMHVASWSLYPQKESSRTHQRNSNRLCVRAQPSGVRASDQGWHCSWFWQLEKPCWSVCSMCKT